MLSDKSISFLLRNGLREKKKIIPKKSCVNNSLIWEEIQLKNPTKNRYSVNLWCNEDGRANDKVTPWQKHSCMRTVSPSWSGVSLLRDGAMEGVTHLPFWRPFDSQPSVRKTEKRHRIQFSLLSRASFPSSRVSVLRRIPSVLSRTTLKADYRRRTFYGYHF